MVNAQRPTPLAGQGALGFCGCGLAGIPSGGGGVRDLSQTLSGVCSRQLAEDAARIVAEMEARIAAPVPQGDRQPPNDDGDTE